MVLPVQISSFLGSTTGCFSQSKAFGVESTHGLDETGGSFRAVDDVVKVVVALEELATTFQNVFFFFVTEAAAKGSFTRPISEADFTLS